ncbi:MAG: phosphatase PAP2 family protein [Candidatus Saccharimonadales bacterium]
MNYREKVRVFDETATKKIGSHIKNVKIGLVIGRLTSPVFWASYLILAHIVWITPGALVGDVLVVIVLLPLASLMKIFIRRKRPATLYVNNMKIKSYSFPSSHAYSSALACGYLAVLCAMNDTVLLVPFILVVAVAVGVSRVVVGAHYPSDVLAGWMLGLVVLSTIAIY